MLLIYQNFLKSYELSVNTIFEICTQVTWWKGKAIKIYSVGPTENDTFISVIIPEGSTGDNRCASKGIHWYQTSSNCFPNSIM